MIPSQPPIYLSFWKAKKPGLRVRPEVRAAYAIADKHHPRFKRAYRTALEDIKTPELLTKLAEAVRNKSVFTIDALIPPFNPADPDAAARWAEAYDTLSQSYASLMRESGKKALAELKINMSLRLQNPYSDAYIQERAGALIADISSQARKNVRELISQSFVDGVTPQATKARIADVIGLTPREAQAVQRRLAQAVKEGVPNTRALDMTRTYSSKLLAARAERITRTETIAGEAQGTLASWRLAQDSGYIAAGTKREWVSGGSENGVCPWCSALDGVQVGFEEMFKTHYGPTLSPPLHARCRCTTVLVGPGE